MTSVNSGLIPGPLSSISSVTGFLHFLLSVTFISPFGLENDTAFSSKFTRILAKKVDYVSFLQTKWVK